MERLAGLWMGIALLFSMKPTADAQGEVTSLRNEPIMSLGRLLSAVHRAPYRHSSREVSQVDVSILSSDFGDIALANLKDTDSWWIWKGRQSPAGAFAPDPRAMPLHPVGVSVNKQGHLILDLDPGRQGLNYGDPFGLFLEAYRLGPAGIETLVVSQRGLTLTVVRPEPTQSYGVGGFAYTPEAELENDKAEPAVHASASFDAPSLGRPKPGAPRYHLVLDSLISSAPTDIAAEVSATVYAEKVRALDGWFETLHLSPFVGLVSSESAQNQSWTAGIQSAVHLRGTAFGSGTIFNSIHDAELVIVPAEYQDWFRRSEAVDLLFMRPDVLVSSASVRWEPIFLFSHKDVPDIDRDLSLHLFAGIWRFHERESEPGPTPGQTVSRFDVEIQVPLEKLGIQRWIPVKARVSIAYGIGAIPTDGYLSASSFSLGIKGSF